MVGSSKILTVSYGTFSCTLEGFDDSFSTMKAIAEYFRGLASDDRYFGAEPPTPDTEMLAKIAEHEISRRVDARVDDGGIVLRAAALTDQSDAPSDEADDAADKPETQHDKDTRAKVEATRKADKAARKAKNAKAKAAKKAKRAAELAARAEADAKDKANEDAKAASVAKSMADAKADALAKAARDAKSEDAAKDAVVGVTKLASDTPDKSSVSSATAVASEGTSGSDVEEARDDAPSSTLAADDPAPIQTPLAHPDSDSIAAKLQRIRAVVDKSNGAKDATNDDLSAQFLPQTETPDVADFDADNEATDDPVAEFDAHESEMVQTTDTSEPDANVQDDSADKIEGGSDMIASVMARQSSADAPDSDEADAQTPVKDDAEPADAAPAQPQARVIRMKRADFEKAVKKGELNTPKAVPIAAPNVDAGPDLGMLDGADDLDDYLEDSDFTDTDLPGLKDIDLADDLAAIKADFADVETEVEAIEEDADASDSDDDTDTMDAVSNAIAAEDEQSGDDTSEDPSDDAASAEESTKAFEAEEPQVDDAALDRLMSETDAQMQEPEGSRRRDAISQLKAAVAAKEAARQVGEPEDDGEDAENAFRNDLSDVVHPEGAAAALRPRPVVLSGNRTERPRPAPLKLVAAQRVDLAESEKRDGPVTPRRVAARQDDAQVQGQAAGSFAEFAENMGASELPDLLEAAAAYTAFVEGADEFSRPQILRRVRAVASDDFNREDGLRSFADLLRAGRFTKVRNGRFQVADDSRYNPERRAS